MLDEKRMENMLEPESNPVSKEERYEIIAQVARALQESRAARSAVNELELDWNSTDVELNFENLDFENLEFDHSARVFN
jgi:hypothetical protein